MFYVSSHDPTSMLYLQAASVRQGTVCGTKVLGHKLVKELPDIATTPFVVEMTEGTDFVAFAFKVRAGSYYLYGSFADKVREFKPPADGKDINEVQLFSLLKLSDARLKGAVELADNEGCEGLLARISSISCRTSS